MNEEKDEQVDILLNSALWYASQADKLLKKYRACKTENARLKLMPKLVHIQSKLGFEHRGLAIAMGINNEGEAWKNES